MEPSAKRQSHAVPDPGPGSLELGPSACGTLRWLADVSRLAQRRAYGADTRKLLQQMLERVVAAFSADSGSFALVDEEGETARIVAAVGLADNAVGQPVRLGEGILGWVISQGEARLLNGDLSDDPRYTLSTAARQTPRPSSAMCWPLVTEFGPIGAVSINRGAERTPFSEREFVQAGALVEMISVVLETVKLHDAHQLKIQELQQAYEQLERTQQQLVQSEKLASVGQLAAGVAHEINNPVGYISSNLGSLRSYVGEIRRVMDAYEQVMARERLSEESRRHIERVKAQSDMEFIMSDLDQLLDESEEGVVRVKQIVQDLKEFSRADRHSWEVIDLHKALEGTLNIAWNELKYKATLERDYADLPHIECMPSQLNQVFMNLLINAAQAIEGRGTVYLRTGIDDQGDHVWVEVEDTGQGIAPDYLSRIFDPFFTTKPVGAGTGLGLSLSYGIVKEHGGEIEVASTPGAGARFRVWLPARHRSADGAEDTGNVGRL